MTAFDLSPPSHAQREALIRGLSADEQRVLLHHGTEAPFCGVFLDNKQDGVYGCRLCGLPLFRSSTKFDSGTGWPSFNDPVAGAVEDCSAADDDADPWPSEDEAPSSDPPALHAGASSRPATPRVRAVRGRRRRGTAVAEEAIEVMAPTLPMLSGRRLSPRARRARPRRRGRCRTGP